jgi:spore coat-associated protein N
VFRRPPDRRVITTGIVLVATVICAAQLHAAITRGTYSNAPRLQISASGSMSISNSEAGAAIFTSSNMAPGGTDQGHVTIGNTGAAPGSLTLAASELSDTPGAYGGALSERLNLEIVDATTGVGDHVYAGPFGSMPEQQLGSLDSGEARTYRFTVSMPDGGPPPSSYAGDNLYQRATASLSYGWILTETGPDGHPAWP